MNHQNYDDVRNLWCQVCYEHKQPQNILENKIYFHSNRYHCIASTPTTKIMEQVFLRCMHILQSRNFHDDVHNGVKSVTNIITIFNATQNIPHSHRRGEYIFDIQHLLWTPE